METKHTPGPWKMSSTGFMTNEGQIAVLQDNENSAHICFVTCQTRYKRGKGWQTQCAERDANARLIAAAPDMKEALEYYAAIKGPMGEPARAALAKAKGE